jgi:hypothetical protein
MTSQKASSIQFCDEMFSRHNCKEHLSSGMWGRADWHEHSNYWKERAVFTFKAEDVVRRWRQRVVTPYRFLVVYEYFRRTYIGLCSTLRGKKDLQLISEVGKKRIYHAWFSNPSTGHQGGWGEEISCLPYGEKMVKLL